MITEEICDEHRTQTSVRSQHRTSVRRLGNKRHSPQAFLIFRYNTRNTINHIFHKRRKHDSHQIRKTAHRKKKRIKEDIIKRIKEAKVMFNNEKQLLWSNNLGLKIIQKLIKSYIWNVALYEPETWTRRKNMKRGSQMHLKHGAEEECYK
jgi:hypothetical protein